MKNTTIILASQSPRRKQLLEQIGINPECRPVDIDETKCESETPLEYCQRLALEKAQTGWQNSNKDKVVLGSDTIVVFDGETLGKPKDKDDAFRMLKLLSGQTHQVITAVSVVYNNNHKTVVSFSDVEFRELDANEIHDYIASKEPMDKAGSYGIQGLAAQWIKNVSGSYSGIMGLPLYETSELLREYV
jgi:septum formation protein